MSNLINYELYKQFHNCLPIVCVDIVLKTADREFLMLKRREHPSKNKWWFVGGRVFKNESLECAARRKVREETGFEVDNLRKIVGGHEIFFKEDPFGHGNGTHAIVSCFSSEIENIVNLKMDKFSSDYKVFRFYKNNWHPYLIKCLHKSGFSAKI